MGAHYYIRGINGEQRYAPLKKDGTPYLRIAKKKAQEDGARIGITTQLKNHLDTGFLFEWAGRLGIQAGFDAVYEYFSGVVGSDDAERLKNIPHATRGLASSMFRKESTKAADRGTEIHDGLDVMLKGGERSEDKIIAEAQDQVQGWLEGHGIDTTTVKAEHCVLFEGGITLEDGRVLELKNGATADLITERLLADYKTLEKAKDGKYYTGKPEHCAQLAFCRHAAWQDGICDADAKCINVYIDRTTGMIVGSRWWTNEELDAGLEFAAHCYECDKAKAKLEGAIK